MESHQSFQKPWLTSQGKPITEAKLRKISQQWSPEEWEEYLSDLETPRSESILGEEHFEKLSDIAHNEQSLFTKATSCRGLKRCLKNLSKKQRKIIYQIFWEGLTNAEIAVRMNISTTAVQKIKERGLNSLKQQMEGVTALRNMRRNLDFKKQGEIHGARAVKNKLFQAS